MNTLYIFGAKYFIYLIILAAVICFFFLNREKKKEAIVFSVIALPIIYIVAKIGGTLYYDPRPFIVGHFTPLISHSPDNGFPSDHALLASALAMVAHYFNKKAGIIFWLFAILVGASRVLVGVHHAIDIVGSMIISIVVAAFVYKFIFPRILRSEFYKNLSIPFLK